MSKRVGTEVYLSRTVLETNALNNILYILYVYNYTYTMCIVCVYIYIYTI